jgi:hypothetical protein
VAQTCLTLVLVVMCMGCLPDPRRLQAERLFERLVQARAELSATPPRLDPACGDVSEVSSRLTGEPGLVELGALWTHLTGATDALWAVCGQATLLEQPFNPTPTTLQARERWQRGVENELAVACDHLTRAAATLGRAAGCN